MKTILLSSVFCVPNFMRSAVLKMSIIRENDLEKFPFLAMVKETHTLGRGREKHGWDMALKQHVLLFLVLV